MNSQQTEWAYLTVRQFCEKHKAFKQGGIRALIFHEKTNGITKAGAVVRVGTKVLLNEPKFFAWIEAQNKGVK